MKDIGVFLIKLSAFLFVGLGASIASIALPLLEYEKEAVVYLSKASESMGQTVNEETCVLEIAEDSFSECTIGLHLAKRYNSYMDQYASIANITLRIGVILFFIGSLLYFKAVLVEKREKASV